MTKKELSDRYAFNTPLKALSHLHTDMGAEMALTSDIRKAYEDGFDKAVELACEWLKENICKDDCGGEMVWCVSFSDTDEMIEDFKTKMEEGV